MLGWYGVCEIDVVTGQIEDVPIVMRLESMTMIACSPRILPTVIIIPMSADRRTFAPHGEDGSRFNHGSKILQAGVKVEDVWRFNHILVFHIHAVSVKVPDHPAVAGQFVAGVAAGNLEDAFRRNPGVVVELPRPGPATGVQDNMEVRWRWRRIMLMCPLSLPRSFFLSLFIFPPSPCRFRQSNTVWTDLMPLNFERTLLSTSRASPSTRNPSERHQSFRTSMLSFSFGALTILTIRNTSSTGSMM